MNVSIRLLLLSVMFCLLPFLMRGTNYDLVSNYHYYYWNYTGEYSYDWAYHYSLQDPVYIDYISNDVFIHEVQNIGGNQVLTYSQNEEGVLILHYRFVTDQNDDMLEMEISGSVHYFFHYLQPGTPDSIMIIQTFYPQQQYHILEYDNGNRLISSTQYRMENSFWVPNFRHQYYYSPSSLHYPTPLNFNLTRLRSLLVGTEYFGCVLDRNVVPDSISGYSWDSLNGWQQNYSPHVGVGLSNGVASAWCVPYFDTFSFNSSGFCTGYTDQGYMQYGYRCNLSWYILTPVDDQTDEPIIPKLTAYPNPFSSSQSIKTDNKDVMDNLSIYNIKGQLVRTWKDIKSNELTWDGKDISNQSVSTGVYIIKAKQGNKISTAKVLKY